MLNSETVSHVAVTTTPDPTGLGNDTTSSASPVSYTALVAIGDTRESFDNVAPDLSVGYTLYFQSPTFPAAGASDWFTVRGERCEVVNGPNGRWGSMGEVVAVRRTGIRP